MASLKAVMIGGGGARSIGHLRYSISCHSSFYFLSPGATIARGLSRLSSNSVSSIIHRKSVRGIWCHQAASRREHSSYVQFSQSSTRSPDTSSLTSKSPFTLNTDVRAGHPSTASRVLTSFSSPSSLPSSQSSPSSSSSSWLSAEDLHVFDTESIVYASWGEHIDAQIECVNVHMDESDSRSPAASSGPHLTVTWRGDGGITCCYPLVWLRDNCRCPSCFNPAARSRMVAMSCLDVNCSVQRVSVSEDKKSMAVVWCDGHVSQYPARWLRCNVFSETDPDPVKDLRPLLWDAAACRSRMRCFDFDDILTDDVVLYEMLHDIKVIGIAVMTNAPLRERQLHRIGARVGYLWPCNYGETFQVQAKVDPSNAAYTSGALPLHTDLSYYQRPPAIQMLHCIKQSRGEGGDNTLVDGFKIADDLRKSSPELYDILTRENVEFYDSGVDAVGEFYQHSRHKVINLDHRGEVNGIVFSDHGRSALSRTDVKKIGKMYQALTSYAALLYDPINVFEYKLKDGDIIIMDNNRVLHGRRAFTMIPGTSRHLEGGYLDWDTVHSKLRVLERTIDA